MSNYRGRLRPQEQEFDLRWWLVPAVLALLVLAAVLAVPSLERRNAVQHAAAPQSMPEATREIADAPVADDASPTASATPGTPSEETQTEEDNHAPTF